MADGGGETKRFKKFLGGFCTVSRKYAAEQMKWFRRDSEYLWVRAELEQPTKELRIAAAAAAMQAGYCCSRQVWAAELGQQPGVAAAVAGAAAGKAGAARADAAVRALNTAEGKKMRLYTPQARALQGDTAGQAFLGQLAGRAAAARRGFQEQQRS